MADEPLRRLVGAMVQELETQAQSTAYSLQVNPPDGMGIMLVTGEVDLYLLAKAITKHIEKEGTS